MRAGMINEFAASFGDDSIAARVAEEGLRRRDPGPDAISFGDVQDSSGRIKASRMMSELPFAGWT
jgi:hypothetical protein